MDVDAVPLTQGTVSPATPNQSIQTVQIKGADVVVCITRGGYTGSGNGD